jgi:hypothetical protein
MRVLGALLFALAISASVYAVVAFTRIWDEQADSPDSTYIEVGLILLGIALLFSTAGWWAWRRSDQA